MRLRKLRVFRSLELFRGVEGEARDRNWGCGAGYTDVAVILARARKEVEVFLANCPDLAFRRVTSFQNGKGQTAHTSPQTAGSTRERPYFLKLKTETADRGE